MSTARYDGQAGPPADAPGDSREAGPTAGPTGDSREAGPTAGPTGDSREAGPLAGATVRDRGAGPPAGASEHGRGAGALTAAPAPTGAGPIGVVGPALAVLVLAAGAAAVREALVGFGVIGGAPLVPGIARTAGGAFTGAWPIPLGAAAVLAGIWLIGTALRPRVRRTFVLTGQTGIFVTRRDVARIASDAAGEVSGVLDARSAVSRRRVVTTVHTLGADSALAGAVRDAIGERLRRLADPPAVHVRVRPSRPDDGGAA